MSTVSALLGNKDLVAEYIQKTGDRRYYPCRKFNKNEAIEEALIFIDCMQRESGESIAWRFTAENDYRIGINYETKVKKSGITFLI
jgi:hypothetical protein